MMMFCGLVIGILTTFRATEFSILLMLSNVVFALILIPVLTFLINDIFPKATGKMLWIRLFGIGVVSMAIIAALFAASMVIALLNNPMDPASK